MNNLQKDYEMEEGEIEDDIRTPQHLASNEFAITKQINANTQPRNNQVSSQLILTWSSFDLPNWWIRDFFPSLSGKFPDLGFFPIWLWDFFPDWGFFPTVSGIFSQIRIFSLIWKTEWWSKEEQNMIWQPIEETRGSAIHRTVRDSFQLAETPYALAGYQRFKTSADSSISKAKARRRIIRW